MYLVYLLVYLFQVVVVDHGVCCEDEAAQCVECSEPDVVGGVYDFLEFLYAGLHAGYLLLAFHVGFDFYSSGGEPDLYVFAFVLDAWHVVV